MAVLTEADVHPNSSALLASLCSKIQLKLCGRKAQGPPIRIDGPVDSRKSLDAYPPWIPAFAGMTDFIPLCVLLIAP